MIDKERIGLENLLMYSEALDYQSAVDINNLQLKGDFEQKVFIISGSYASDSEEQILLDKMLAATKLTMKDIYFLQVSDKQPLLTIINKLKPSKIICFGQYMDGPSLTFSKRLYNLSQINDIKLLTTHELSVIITNNELKQALWNGLKKMFNL